MANSRIQRISALLLACLIGFVSMLAVPSTAEAVFDPIPDDDDFAPFLCDGEPAWDPHGDDQSNHRDIVGDETRPAVLRAATDDHLYLRIRLDGDPRQNANNLRPFGWGFLFDTPPLNFSDGDDSTNTYDYLLHLNGTGSPGLLTLFSNEGQLELDDPTAEAAGDIEWEVEHDDPDPIWHVQEAPGDPVGSEPNDYHLTIAIPWDDLVPYGITPDGVTVLWTGTTTSNNSIDRDFACHTAGGDDLTMSEFPTDEQPLDPAENPCASGDYSCPDNSACVYESGGDYSCQCDDGFATDDDECFEIVTITTPEEGDEVQTSTPTVEGTAEAGASVVIYVDGDEVDTVEADGDGNWSWTAPDNLDNGEVTVNAESTSDNGTTTSDSVTFTIDGEDAPVIITSPGDGDVIDDDTPTIGGTGEPGDTVVIYVDGDEVDSVDVDQDGNWSWTPDEPLDEGENTISAESDADPDSNDSVTFTVNPDADAPVVITSPGDGDVIDDDTPTIGGTGEPGDTVVISVDGDEVDSVDVDQDGNWSWTPDEPLDEGETTISAESDADPDSNDSVTFTVNPEEEDDDEPVVITTDDGHETNDDRPTIDGTGEPGDTVVIYVDGEEVDSVEVDQDGNWSWTPDEPFDEGETTITAESASDPDSNDTVTITVDPDADAPIVITTDADSEFDDDIPTIDGTGEPGDVVVIYVDGEEVDSVEVDDDGNWTWTSDEPLEEGETTITAESTSDPDSSDSVTFTVDADVAITTEDGHETNDDRPTIDGTGEPGAVVIISVDGEEVATVEVDEDGNWSWTPDESMEDGDYRIDAHYEDDEDEDGASITITIDTVPAHIEIEYVVPGDSDDDDGSDTVVIGGTAKPGSQVDIIVDGEIVDTVTADEDGNWEAEVEFDEGGDQDLVVTATDNAGNSASDDYDFATDAQFSLSGGGVACSAASSGSAPTGDGLLALLLLGLLAIKARRPRPSNAH